MKCLVSKSDGTVATIDADPICGEDFCDICGDCLACYGDLPCVDGDHLWVKEEHDIPLSHGDPT